MRACGILLLVIPLCGCGCSKSAPSVPGAPASPDDPMAAAPASWPAFMDWARGEIADPPMPMAMPEARWPAPRWSACHLEEKLKEAIVQCDWAPPDADGQRALASIGPFRSDQPGPNLQVKSAELDASRRIVLMVFAGFMVPRERVGTIVVELRQPAGDHFELKWSDAGRIRIPIPDNQRLWSLHIATDGFADWAGMLDVMSLRVRGANDEPTEIRSIRFLPHVDSFPRPVGAQRVTIGREIRNTLYMHCPAEVRFDRIAVPSAGRLQIGLGQVAPLAMTSTSADSGRAVGSEHAATVVCEALIVEGDVNVSLLRQEVAAGQDWLDVTASLERWAGREVSLVLRATAEVPGAVACWGNPVVYEHLDDPPCVILYLIDAVAAGHVGLYGYDRQTMPTLASLAERGVWFAHAFSNSPRTVESVPDMLFSLPTERHGVTYPSFRAPDELVSLPESLRAAGFATAFFCTNVNAGTQQNTDQGFDHFVERYAYMHRGDPGGTVPIPEVMRWLEVHRGRPTFVYVHTVEPHAPYAPPPGYAGRFDTGYDGPIDGTYDPKHGFMASANPRDLAHAVALYNEELLYADARLGMFLDAVAAFRPLEHVQLFVTADHGEEFLEHGFWQHGGNLHNEQTRIPLLAAGPGVTARGRCGVPAQLLDLMPTILEMQQVEPPYPLAGSSILPLLAGDPGHSGPARGSPAGGSGGAPPDLAARSVFASNYNYSRSKAAMIEHAVVEAGRWKLIVRRPRDAPEDGSPVDPDFALYDVRADPLERTDVIDGNQQVARRLVGQLIRWQRQQAPFQLGSKKGLELDAGQLHQLRSLGYVK